MGKRYFCDYCDRSFQDNMHNRKKHLNGVQHHRAKKAWFDHFRDSAAVLHDELEKKPCRKFLQRGFCDFGPNCRFSHMSEVDLAHLRRQVEEEKQRRENTDDRVPPERSIDEWLSRREKKKSALAAKGDAKTEEEEEAEEEEEEKNQVERDVRQKLLSIPDLPPSLMPPPPGGWKVNVNTEWG